MCAQEVSSEEFYYQLGKRYDDVVFAEKHDVPGNQKIYGDPEFYSGFAKAGYTTIGLELPVELQPVIDAYLDNNSDYFDVENPGQITPAVLVPHFAGYDYSDGRSTPEKSAQDLGVKLEGAKANNMRVVAFDDRTYDESLPNPLKAQEEFVKNTLDTKGFTEEQLREDLGLKDVSVSPYIFLAARADIAEQYMDNSELTEMEAIPRNIGSAERMTADQSWVQHLPADEKTIMVVGRDHPSNIIAAAGIDELRGGDDRVATIAVYQNEEEKNAFYADRADYDGFLQPPADDPHVEIFTDDMSVNITEKLDVEGYSADEELAITKLEPPQAPASSSELRLEHQP